MTYGLEEAGHTRAAVDTGLEGDNSPGSTENVRKM